MISSRTSFAPVLIGIFFGATALAGFAFGQQQKPSQYEAGNVAPGIASAADYYDILDMDARFCQGLDSGAKSGQMFADVFLPDGVYADTPGHEVSGAMALAKLAEASSGAGRLHFTLNVRLQPAAGGMRQWSYLLVTGPLGQKEVVIEGGQYWDDLIKTPTGWRIKRRTFLPSGSARPEGSAIFTLDAPPHPEAVQRKTAEAHSDLSPADRAEIFQLYAHYPFALDKALNNGQMFANLFSAEGTMVARDATTVTGRSQLAEYVWRRGLTDFKTYITNITLTDIPAGVEAKAYVMEALEPQIPAPSTITPVGMFVDQLVKTPQGWRFQRKSLVSFRDGFARAETPTSSQKARTARHTGVLAPGAGDLTADDYAAIQQIYARYAHGYDSKLDDGALYLSVFAKTGRFTDQYNSVADGFAALDKKYAHSQTGQPNPIGIGHSTWNVLVDAAPWGAVGRSYTGGGRINTPSTLSPGLLGEYLDMLVRTPDGWRFERRTFRQDFQRPVGQVGGGPPAVSGGPTRTPRR